MMQAIKTKKVSTFNEINKEKMSEEDVGPAISSQLAEVTHKYWTDEARSQLSLVKLWRG